MTTPIEFSIRHSPARPQPVEIVERKGRGHPDTLCDLLAEEVSRALCRHYRDRFGTILHHNVDKALLVGGVSRSRFGGGEVVLPMELYLAGRATGRVGDTDIDVDDIAVDACRQWLGDNMHALDPDRHIRLKSLIRPGSSDLVELYARQAATGVALANDTSCGVAHAPLSALERIVLAVEHMLNSPAVRASHPAVGEDVKVMGVRRGEHIELTVACAMIDRHLARMDDYLAAKRGVVELVKARAREIAPGPLAVAVNTADDPGSGSVYLTVTGTSAESGDDGEVGRGNRVNGLITPYRPMNMEAACGKNPVTHVGKLYNIVARRIVDRLVGEVEAIRGASCYLVSRIGYPVREPRIVDIDLATDGFGIDAAVRGRVREIALDALDRIDEIPDLLIAGEIDVC
jgi:S-adenosylmethionine synthetase